MATHWRCKSCTKYKLNKISVLHCEDCGALQPDGEHLLAEAGMVGIEQRATNEVNPLLRGDWTHIPEGNGKGKGCTDNASFTSLTLALCVLLMACAGVYLSWSAIPFALAIVAVFFLAVIVVIVSVIVLSSSHAWWIVPPYPVDDITERDILLSWSEEKALTASDHPLNDFTCIGTHNSTHGVSIFGALFIKEWHYVHAPLGAQLQLGIRHVEIDIWYNSCASRWEAAPYD